MKHDFTVITTNYRKNFGEIDIICESNSTQKLHFIEVKTVSRETLTGRGIRPEDHVTREKVRKIERVTEKFISEFELFDKDFQIDLICIVLKDRVGSVYFIENINF